MVHGEIRLEGGEARLSHNLTGRLDGYVADPASGNLALTEQASQAINHGAPRLEAVEDIRGRPRGARPDLDAWETGVEPEDP